MGELKKSIVEHVVDITHETRYFIPVVDYDGLLNVYDGFKELRDEFEKTHLTWSTVRDIITNLWVKKVPIHDISTNADWEVHVDMFENEAAQSVFHLFAKFFVGYLQYPYIDVPIHLHVDLEMNEELETWKEYMSTDTRYSISRLIDHLFAAHGALVIGIDIIEMATEYKRVDYDVLGTVDEYAHDDDPYHHLSGKSRYYGVLQNECHTTND